MAPTSPSSLRRQLDADGFVVLPALLPPSQLPALLTACTTLAALARAGHWPHLRTLPTPFPPWPSASPHGIWGVQHLLHPSLPLPLPSRSALAESYFGPAVTAAAAALMNCDADEDLVMELYNLLIDPPTRFALPWHRDDVPRSASDEAERRALGVDARGAYLRPDAERGRAHVQWNLALREDASLVVVPGSHWRARTEGERREGAEAEGLEGMRVVRLGPGEAVFYDQNVLHRGVYEAGRERVTLHGSIGRRGCGGKRAMNVLQHGVGEWVGRCTFEGLEGETKERAERMRDRLVEMGSGEGLGYSHAA